MASANPVHAHAVECGRAPVACSFLRTSALAGCVTELIEDRDVDLLVDRERNLAWHLDQRRLEDAVTKIERVGPDEEAEVWIAHDTSFGASHDRFGRIIGAGDSSMPP